MRLYPFLRQPRRFSHWWIVIPAWLAGWLFLAGRCETTPFSGDESGWISSSLESTRRMLDGGWVDFERWDPPPAGPWGSLNPPLGKWMIGVPLSVYCWTQGTRFDRYYDFWATGAENLRRGNVPPADILLAARRIVAFYGSLLILAAVWLGCRLRNPGVGVAAGGAILLDPLFQAVSTMALTDTLCGLFLMLVAASLCRASDPPGGGGDPRRYFLPGWLTGMLGLIKVSSCTFEISQSVETFTTIEISTCIVVIEFDTLILHRIGRVLFCRCKMAGVVFRPCKIAGVLLPKSPQTVHQIGGVRRRL